MDGLNQVVHNPFYVPVIQEPDLGLVTFDLKDTPPVPAPILAELSCAHAAYCQRLDHHGAHPAILVERVFQLDYPVYETETYLNVILWFTSVLFTDSLLPLVAGKTGFVSLQPTHTHLHSFPSRSSNSQNWKVVFWTTKTTLDWIHTNLTQGSSMVTTFSALTRGSPRQLARLTRCCGLFSPIFVSFSCCCGLVRAATIFETKRKAQITNK